MLSTIHPDTASSLMLAIIDSSNAPLLLLDADLTILAASESFSMSFAVDPKAVIGRLLTSLGNGEWNVPQLESLLKATAAGNAQIDSYEMDLKRPGQKPRCLVVNAQKLVYADIGNVRLLVSIVDITEARLAEKLKDDLLREKAILLQELQHRVANSLQIIASVLLQSARRVNSPVARGHLNDAHNRVMSVASVQQQLAASRIGQVELRTYFNDLCRSIGASMIRDHKQITLEVHADDSIAGADTSVSLGLIVTELVINALKHAFPGHRHGAIVVRYRAEGTDWTLSVGDDGIGFPKDVESRKAGLGTSIVEALSRQLEARVEVAGAKPGTMVSIIHRQANTNTEVKRAAA